MKPTDVPLFPLNTVLFPGGVLPLKIFETRYVDMVRRCMRSGDAFGITLIQKGVEAGGPASSYAVGTLAVIVDFDQLSDGLLGITARGTQRFKILQSRTQADGLNVASIELLKDDAAIALPDAWRGFAQMLEEALPQMGDFFKHLKPQYDDAGWVAARLTEIMPLPLYEKQKVLETNDPLEQLRMLEPHLREHDA